MKVETPQILWHNAPDDGKPAPLYSVSFLPSSTNNDDNVYSTSNSSKCRLEILATAGNTSEIHLWKLGFETSNSQDEHETSADKPFKTTKNDTSTPAKAKILGGNPQTTIAHHLTLNRHDRSINSVSFSPKGTHLASAGDGGSLIVFSIPHSHRYHPHQHSSSSSSTCLFWKSLQHEKELTYKILHTCAEDVMDISWCKDDKRFMVGTLDHSMLVFEEVVTSSNIPNTNLLQGENTHSSSSSSSSSWNCIYRNSNEHVQYVQGVAYDPLGAYLASQGSDRTVRVWMRKKQGNNSKNGQKKKEQVLGTLDNNASSTPASPHRGNTTTNIDWMNGKFELGKPKLMKYLQITEQTNSNSVMEDEKGVDNENQSPNATTKKLNLFADESTVESFFRRLSWTTDGAFLITPTSIWSRPTNNIFLSAGDDGSSSNSFCTFLFARHHFDQPYKILSGLEKPSVVIRPNPILFELPSDIKNELKENMSSSTANENKDTQKIDISYRSIFAVLTLDTVLIYDTYHSHPLCIAKGLHYASLTDCTWTSDGNNLIVSSTDGYISILSFELGELGEPYLSGDKTIETTGSSFTTTTSLPSLTNPKSFQYQEHPVIPPCEPGQNSKLMAPPSKKTKLSDTTNPSPSSTDKDTTKLNSNNDDIAHTLSGSKRNVETIVIDGDSSEVVGVEKDVVGRVINLTLENQDAQKKKKKRVQPTLLSC